MPCITVHYSAVQCCVLQCITLQCSAVDYKSAQYSAEGARGQRPEAGVFLCHRGITHYTRDEADITGRVGQCSAVQCSVVQCSAV